MVVSLRDQGQFEECFKLQADLSYEKFLFVSALSGKAVNNHHYVRGVAAVDLGQLVDKATLTQ